MAPSASYTNNVIKNIVLGFFLLIYYYFFVFLSFFQFFFFFFTNINRLYKLFKNNFKYAVKTLSFFVFIDIDFSLLYLPISQTLYCVLIWQYLTDFSACHFKLDRKKISTEIFLLNLNVCNVFGLPQASTYVFLCPCIPNYRLQIYETLDR